MSARTIRAFLVALTPAVAIAASPPPATQPAAPPAVLKLANAVINASNTDDPSSLSRLYTSDATVVDEIDPFVWRGAGAGVAWWRSVENVLKKEHHHIKLIGVRVGEFQKSANAAYLIEAMTISDIGAGRTSRESGTLTFTFHRSGGRWLISSQAWTTKP